jgi:hypothetical protein
LALTPGIRFGVHEITAETGISDSKDDASRNGTEGGEDFARAKPGTIVNGIAI